MVLNLVWHVRGVSIFFKIKPRLSFLPPDPTLPPLFLPPFFMVNGRVPPPEDDTPDMSGHAIWYPLWTEDGCALPAEYFNADEAKKCSNKEAKNTSFTPFLDECGKVLLPAPLAGKVAKWERADDIYENAFVPEGEEKKPPTIVSEARAVKVVHPRPLGASEKMWLRKKQLGYQDKLAEPIVNLNPGNDHLLGSEVIRTLLAYCGDLQTSPEDGGLVQARPWELIYPQVKDPDTGIITPTYNKAGKYIVKLFWMGSWRKVTVDDFVPLDAHGNWLLPQSQVEVKEPAKDCADGDAAADGGEAGAAATATAAAEGGSAESTGAGGDAAPSGGGAALVPAKPKKKVYERELWLTLVAKAVLKLASCSYEREVGRAEQGDARILQMLTGWQTEVAPVGPTPTDHQRVAKLLHSLVTPAKVDAPIDMTPPPPEPEEPELTEEEAAAAAAATEAGKGKDKKKGKKDKGGDDTSGSSSKRESSAQGSRKASVVPGDGSRGSVVNGAAAEDGGDGDGGDGDGGSAAEPEDRRAVFVDAQFVAGSELPEGCGFTSEHSHPVRVLGCFYLDPSGRPSGMGTGPVDYSNVDGWVVKCASHSMLYNGGLAYGDDNAWHMSVQAGLGVARDTEEAEQEYAVAQHAEGNGHPAFAWHMRLSEFCNVFKTLNVHHLISDLQTIILETPVGPSASEIRYSPEKISSLGGNAAPAKGEVPTNFSEGQPQFFCVDSLAPSRVVVSLAVTQSAQPRYPGDQPDTEPAAPAEGGDAAADDAAAAGSEGGDDAGAGEEGGDAEEGGVTRPEQGAVFVETFLWNDGAPARVALDLVTNSSACGVLELPAGRHLFKIVLDCKHTYSLTLSSQQEIVLGEEEQVLGLLDGSSMRLQEHVATTFQALQIMLLNPEKADEVIKMIAEGHIRDHADAVAHTKLFFKSLLWALEKSFGPDWMSGENQSAEAIAWTRHLNDLLKRSLASVKTLLEGRGAATEQASVASTSSEGGPDAELAGNKAAAAIEASRVQIAVDNAAGAAPTPPTSRPTSTVSNRASSAKRTKSSKKTQGGSAKGGKSKVEPEAPAKLPTPDEAACMIQKHFRGFNTRQAVGKRKQEVLEAERPLIAESWEKIGNNLLEFGVLVFRRMFDLDNALINDFAFVADELQRAKLADFRGELEEKPANQWFALFKDVFHFTEVTDCLAQFRVVIPTPEDTAAPQVSPEIFQLLITNNDTLEAVPSAFGRPLLHMFKPNKNGYTFMAVGRSPIPVPKLEWSLRVLSFPDFPCDVERTLNMAIEPKVESGPARPMTTPGSAASEISTETGEIVLKYDVLFRYDIEIAAVQELVGVAVSVDPVELPDAILSLQVLEDGVEVGNELAKHIVIFPNLRFKGVPRPESAADEGAADKKGKDKPRGKSAKKGAKSAPAKPAEPKRENSLTVDDAANAANQGPPPVGSKYTVVGRLISGGTPATPSPTASAATSKPPAGKDKKKKPKSANAGATDTFPSWTMQVVSQSPDLIAITPNHAREDEIKEKKTGWEAVAAAHGEEGRAEAAKNLREEFVTVPDPDAAAPDLTVGPNPRFLAEAEAAAQEGSFTEMLAESKKPEPTISAFDMALDNARRSARAKMQNQYRAKREELLGRRRSYAGARGGNHKQDLDQFTQLREGRQAALTTRQSLRAAYRQRIIDEAEAKQKADEARLAAIDAEKAALEIAMEGAERPPSRSDKKKK